MRQGDPSWHGSTDLLISIMANAAFLGEQAPYLHSFYVLLFLQLYGIIDGKVLIRLASSPQYACV